MIVIYRNGVRTVITGWREWLLMLAAAVMLVVVFCLTLGIAFRQFTLVLFGLPLAIALALLVRCSSRAGFPEERSRGGRTEGPKLSRGAVSSEYSSSDSLNPRLPRFFKMRDLRGSGIGNITGSASATMRAQSGQEWRDGALRRPTSSSLVCANSPSPRVEPRDESDCMLHSIPARLRNRG